MNKIITLFLSLFVFVFPIQAKANPWAVIYSENKGRIAPLKEGEKAPFAGTLFDVDASAQILVDKETEKERCKIEKEEALERQKALYELQLANANAAKEAAQQQLKEVLVLKNEHIDFLNKQIEKSSAKPKREWSAVWFAGGLVGGIVLTAVSAYTFKQINK